jgi:hypothetical protein
MPFLEGSTDAIRKEYIGIGVVVTAIVAASFVMGLRIGFNMGLKVALGV